MRNARYKMLTRFAAAFLIVAAIAVAFSAFYVRGYRLSLKPFSVTPPGTIFIEGARAGDLVYLDGKRASPSFGRDGASLSVSANIHGIVMSRAGMYPWAKSVTVEARHTASLAPFFVLREPRAERIGATDPRYSLNFPLASAPLLPTEDKPRRATSSQDLPEYVSAFIQGTDIYAAWQGAESTLPRFFCAQSCLTRVDVASLKSPVASVDFYPGRPDVILFATGDLISAIEIDRRGIQNFQPVYQSSSTAVTFSIAADGSLYAADGKDLVLIDLPR